MNSVSDKMMASSYVTKKKTSHASNKLGNTNKAIVRFGSTNKAIKKRIM